MSKQNKSDGAVKKTIKRLFLFFLALVFIALFYVLAILIEPEKDPTQQEQDSLFIPRDVLSPQAPHQVTQISQIGDLTYLFPGPLMFLQEDESIVFLGADLYDLAYEQGYARVARLTYTVKEATPISLYSIYPKEAFSLLGKEKLHLTTSQEYLSIFPAVRMEGSGDLRLHAQGNLALYALTVPTTLKDQLSALGRSTVLLAQPFDEETEAAAGQTGPPPLIEVAPTP